VFDPKLEMLAFGILLICLIVFQAALCYELNPSNFVEDVVNDNRVWLVRFSSKQCDSCKEFQQTWNKLTLGANHFLSGEINIDDPDGGELAKKLGVMDEGVPNLRLFCNVGDNKGVLLYGGGNGGKPRVHEMMISIHKSLQGTYQRYFDHVIISILILSILVGHAKDGKGVVLKEKEA